MRQPRTYVKCLDSNRLSTHAKLSQQLQPATSFSIVGKLFYGDEVELDVQFRSNVRQSMYKLELVP
jgi:hypothetical protein